MKASVTQYVHSHPINKAVAQYGLPLGPLCLNSGLLARSRCASGRSCDRPTGPKFSVICLSPRVNADMVPKPTLHCMLLVLSSQHKLSAHSVPLSFAAHSQQSAPIALPCSPPPACLHQKDEGALRGNLQSSILSSSMPTVIIIIIIIIIIGIY
jgi:hypothetical protein